MKKTILLIIAIVFLLCGCSASQPAQLVATTLPVYEFTARLCNGTELSVALLITENVSCLHDYTIKPDQMQAIEQAEHIIINGAGLEAFMADSIYGNKSVIDASHSLVLSENNDHNDHAHEDDPHIWLSPENAKIMVKTICSSLIKCYPHYQTQFEINKDTLLAELDALQIYGEDKLSNLSCRKIITFHDGFSYLAESFHLEILRAIEEEAGSEASAKDVIEIISLVKNENLPSIFVETNGSTASAKIIQAETGVKIFTLDMAMSGSGYFESMYHNIDTLWEALR